MVERLSWINIWQRKPGDGQWGVTGRVVAAIQYPQAPLFMSACVRTWPRTFSSVRDSVLNTFVPVCKETLGLELPSQGNFVFWNSGILNPGTGFHWTLLWVFSIVLQAILSGNGTWTLRIILYRRRDYVLFEMLPANELFEDRTLFYVTPQCLANRTGTARVCWLNEMEHSFVRLKPLTSHVITLLCIIFIGVSVGSWVLK